MKFNWEKVIPRVISEYSTPCYIAAWPPVMTAISELAILDDSLPIKHWLSLKTHPLAHLARNWKNLGLGVEVVSEFEFQAALAEGFPPELILVNGPAKHTWLPKHPVNGIRVHFDSVIEVRDLITIARDRAWHVGLRVHVSAEYDPDQPDFPDQFGLEFEEAGVCLQLLKKRDIQPVGIHFHLRTNVYDVKDFVQSIDEIALFCRKTGFRPLYIDCGGGFPTEGETVLHGNAPDMSTYLSEVKLMLGDMPRKIPSIQEIWFENGRFLSARSCVLVVRVIDIKERDKCRFLICDGGRTNHAFPSDWEIHEISTIPVRKGDRILTTICGPSCMAYDRLIRIELPDTIEIGDLIIWKNAGAYHLPWETRFSTGLAKVIWCSTEDDYVLARAAESFSEWWGTWI